MLALTLERMRADIADSLQEEASAIHDNANLIDLGLDSLRAMGLFVGWSEKGVPIDFAEFASVPPTLSQWWAIVAAKSGQQG